MKYYYNEKTGTLLIDTNEYTPYLNDRGYIEVSKKFYDAKSKEIEERIILKGGEDYAINEIGD